MRRKLSGIDTLSKYYFDRSYDNYKTIVHSDISLKTMHQMT